MNIDHQNIGAGSLITYVAAIAVSVSATAAGVGFMVRVGWEAAGSVFG